MDRVLIVLFLFGICSFLSDADAADCTVDNVELTRNPTSIPVIGSEVTYTFTCTVMVTCTDTDNLTISFIRNGESVNDTDTIVVSMIATYTHYLTLSTPINISHAGLYSCNAIVDGNTTMVTSSLDFEIKLPTPVVVAQGSSVTQLMTNATVQCNITLMLLSLYPTDTFVTVMWTPNTMESLENRTFDAADSVTDMRTFPSSLVNAGVYSCSAFLFYNGSDNQYVIDSAVSTENDTTVQITIQTPTVTVSSVIVAVGEEAVLNCTVETAEPSLVNTVISWSPANGNGISMYTVTNVSSDTAVEYTCSATINPIDANTNIISSSPGSGVGTVYATEISTSTTATSGTIRLDVTPYNDFTLHCNLTYYPIDAININVELAYTDNNANDSVSNIDTSSSNNVTTNTQSVTITGADANTVLQYQYTCTATVTADNADTFMNNDSVTITVRGPANPNMPQLSILSVNSNSATVSWSVSSVSYTPETFTVYYGEADDDLSNSVSDNVMSEGQDDESFLTDMDRTYSATIISLTSGVMYYYQINSTNSVGSTLSVVGNFTTGESAPSMPTNVMLNTPTATSLQLQWGVPNMPNGVITGYTYSCDYNNNSLASPIMNTDVATDTLSVTLNDLRPFTEYTCDVTASTSGGASGPGTDTAVTGQAAPTGAPTEFTVTPNNDNPDQLMLSWMPPDIEERNGIIIRYYYNCTHDNYVTMSSGNTSANDAVINNLLVFTMYTCRVRAATEPGIGNAAVMSTRTGEDAPTAVRDLNSDGRNDTAIYISWTVPETLNGIVIHYSVTIADYNSNASVYQQNSSTLNITINSSNLSSGIPYRIFVTAVTGGGSGPPVSGVNFTQQGTPSEVQDVTANRINGTAMNVTWRQLTIVEARGFLDEYTVTLTPNSGSRKRQSAVITKSFSADTSGGIVTGLSSSITYIVTVSLSNEGGIEGPTIPGQVVEPIPVESNITTIIAIIVVVGAIILLIIVIIIVALIVVFLRMGHSKESLVHENLSALEDKRQNQNGSELQLLSVRVAPEFSERMNPVPMEDFADHVRQLHMNRDLGFEEEYETVKKIPSGSYVVAKMQNNTSKNRFDNVYSYDHSRVVLPITDGCTDYINASFIDGYKRPKAYIAAQGPLPLTVVDFWRMIWEFQLPTVVMLTELVERGIEKCTCYYPRNNNETMDVGNGLKVTLIEQQQFVEYKYKKFLLLNTNDSDGGRLDVTHYHFLAWPDHGVPADKTVMMAFARRVRQTHPPEGPPLIVHCSAGVGRTGTFIILDTMMQRIEKKESSLNIYELVADMRTRRTLMVQTMAQYIYTHDALSEYIICGDTSITTKGLRDRMNELSKVSGGESGYQKQLKLLNDISRLPSEGHCSDSLSKQNVIKNRYSQIITSLPYNETRVRLRTTSGVGDYINASVVDGYKHRGAFLATQTPLESTVCDLWRMVWEHWSASIVMLCNMDEEESIYCYWPTEIDKKSVYGMIEVKLVSEKEEKDFMVRKFELSQESNYVNLATGNADKLLVTQYQYHKWSSDSKPSKCDSFLEMLNQLLKTQKLSGNKAITVICNDGVNRTGAFICLYSQLERVKVEGVADIFQFVKSSRFHRAGLVESVDNYIFCHEVLLEFLNSFDQYENFK